MGGQEDDNDLHFDSDYFNQDNLYPNSDNPDQLVSMIRPKRSNTKICQLSLSAIHVSHL